MASRLSDLARDGALNDVLVHLNRSADADRGAVAAGRVDSLRGALDELCGLLGAGEVIPPGEREALLAGARAASAQELVERIHLVLQKADHKLVAYGTLVPGGMNHDRVAALRGTWQRCFVRGRRWTAADGDPAFRWSPGEPEVAAMLLVSERLPSAWPELDRFEGSPYRRHLVPVRGEEAYHVAYLYESVDQTGSN